MKKFYNNLPVEQETIINIDYFNSMVTIYTSQKSVYKRLCQKLNMPSHTYYTNNQISGAKWEIPFSDKTHITMILSRPTLIGQKK